MGKEGLSNADAQNGLQRLLSLSFLYSRERKWLLQKGVHGQTKEQLLVGRASFLCQ